MILLSPLRADPAAPLAAANPLAKLGAAAVVMLVLFLSVDPVTPLLMLGAIAAGIALSGIPARALLVRSGPLFVAAAGAALVNGLFGNVDVSKGVLIGIPAVFGVVAGTALQQRVPVRVLNGIFAVLMVVSAALLVF